MENINQEIIALFPSSQDIDGPIRRDDALLLLRRTAMASRAAIDEITGAAAKTLSGEEQFRLGVIAEQLASLAVDVATWQNGPQSKPE